MDRLPVVLPSVPDLEVVRESLESVESSLSLESSREVESSLLELVREESVALPEVEVEFVGEVASLSSEESRDESLEESRDESLEADAVLEDVLEAALDDVLEESASLEESSFDASLESLESLESDEESLESMLSIAIPRAPSAMA